jgi:hypothetical protein
MEGSDVVTKAQIARLVRRIARTLETELDCGDCGKHVPPFVDAILAGDDAIDRWGAVRQHLEECSVCAQEFAALREIAKMDLEDNWPIQAIMLEMAARRQLNA